MVSRRLLAPLAVSLWLVACQPREIPIAVEVVTEACAGPAPMERVTHLRMRITGEDMTPVQSVVPISTHALEIPEIPPGDNRVLEVRAYEGEPTSGGRVRALGRTLAFSFSGEAGDRPAKLAVFLRTVDSLTRPSLAVSPSSCTRMRAARAGHTATLLPSGKVLIAGGFQRGATEVPRAISGVELFNPATGSFEEGPELGIAADGALTPSPRARHTANVLPTGELLLVGGEYYDDAGAVKDAPNALLLVPEASVGWSALSNLLPRSRHGVATLEDGRTLFVGGRTATGIAELIEWFTPADGNFHVGSARTALTELGVAPISGDALVVAGGLAANVPQSAVNVWRFDTAGQPQVVHALALPEARWGAAAVPFGTQPARVLVLGGWTGTDPTAPSLASTHVVEVEPGSIQPGPTMSPRGYVCAVTVPDGRVVAVGGRTLGFSEMQESDPTLEMIVPTTSGPGAVLGMPSLDLARYHHTCTVLHDGSVLILGGVHETEMSRDILDDAVIFMPAPLD
jgi:hypothetical protein